MVTRTVCNGCQTVACMGTMRAMTSVACFAGTVVGPAGAVLSTRGSTQSSVGLVLLCTGALTAWFAEALTTLQGFNPSRPKAATGMPRTRCTRRWLVPGSKRPTLQTSSGSVIALNQSAFVQPQIDHGASFEIDVLSLIRVRFE